MVVSVVSTIDDEPITGAFALAVDVLFLDLSAGSSQTVFAFSNASGTSRIWFGQAGDGAAVEFGVERDGIVHRVVAQDAIVEGVHATWRVGVDPDGTMRIAKDYDLLVQGPGAVPDDALRDIRSVGVAREAGHADLAGRVVNLKIANYGDADALDPISQASPCATTGEARCLCDKLRPDGAVAPGQDGPTEVPVTDAEGDGEWSAVQSLGIIPIHAMVLPDGKVFSFGTDETGVQGGQFVYSLYDPETGIDIILPNTTDTDIFCSSMSLDPVTGNVLITGGDARGEGGTANQPVNDVVVFDYATRTIRDATQGEMAFDRWYNSSVTLSNGEILTLGGLGDGRNRPEVYNAETGWRELTGVDIDVSYYYPKTWVTSDGSVVVLSENGQMYRIDPEGQGASEAIGRPNFSHVKDQPGIMYDVDRVAILGTDGRIWTADLSADRPSFTAVAQTASARRDGGMSVLPDGRVILTGGNEGGRNNLDGAVHTPEIWDPVTNTVEAVADHALARLYHSSHLLMPNGMIWSGGGGAPGPMTNTNIEVYAPSYLYDAAGGMADRPQILEAPGNVGNDARFRITVEDAADIARVTAVRTGALTHAVNSDTRFVELDYSVIDGDTLEIATPGAGAMVPGAWMLFVLDAGGVPSVASMLGVAMAPLVETANLEPTEAGLDIYGIDDDPIEGAFEITLEARFDDLSGGAFQRIFDFGNGPGQDNVVLGQVGSSDDIALSLWVDGTRYGIVAPGAIVEGETAKWTANVDASGYMRLWKDDVLVAEGQGAVPAGIDRANKLVGASNWAEDDRLAGMVRYLETVNAGDAPEYVHIGLPRIALHAPGDIAEGAAGETGTLRFEIVLDQPAPAIVSADVTIRGGSGPAQVVIPAGQSRAFIDVTVAGNDAPGAGRTVSVALDGVTQARIAGPLEAQARVLDDDASQGAGIAGRYFIDHDGSGTVTEGDVAVAGAEIRLLRNARDVATTVTDAEGRYRFDGIEAGGGYRVAFENPEDSLDEPFDFITSRAGDDPLADSEVIWTDGFGDGTTRRVSLTEGETTLGMNGGLRGEGAAPPPPPGPGPVEGSAKGRAFTDRDGAGRLTEAGAPVEGAPVRLMRDGREIASTVTDAEGRYRFDGIEPGPADRVIFPHPEDAPDQTPDPAPGPAPDTPPADAPPTSGNGGGSGTGGGTGGQGETPPPGAPAPEDAAPPAVDPGQQDPRPDAPPQGRDPADNPPPASPASPAEGSDGGADGGSGGGSGGSAPDQPLLRGTEGREWLLGTAAGERFEGLAGQDVLISGGGDDVMTGGDDPDMFAFARVETRGATEITDFSAQDRIVLDDQFFGLGTIGIALRAVTLDQVMAAARLGLVAVDRSDGTLTIDPTRDARGDNPFLTIDLGHDITQITIDDVFLF